MRGYRAKLFKVIRTFICDYCKQEWVIGTEAHPRARKYYDAAEYSKTRSMVKK